MSMKNSRISKISSTLLILQLLLAVIIYSRLPDQVPSHWNINGEIDAYMSKEAGAFLLPTLSTALYIFLGILPKIDPKREQFENSMKYYEGFRLVFVLFLFYIYLLTLLAAFGTDFNIGQLLSPALGLMFIFIGHVLPKIKQNWFMGIRTPWTISNESVWQETHRVGGKLFKISGGIALFGALLPGLAFYMVITPVLVAALASVIYSYMLYREEAGRLA